MWYVISMTCIEQHFGPQSCGVAMSTPGSVGSRDTGTLTVAACRGVQTQDVSTVGEHDQAHQQADVQHLNSS